MELTAEQLANTKKQFFAKGQACLRASPLAKRYGWGIHFNLEGKIAIIGVDSKEYHNLVKDKSIQKIKAMRSAKK
jgi:hypothetical protein